jgi:hypothetical protein
MEPRLEQLADVLVEIVVREVQHEKKPPMPDKQSGGFGAFRGDDTTAPGTTSPTA